MATVHQQEDTDFPWKLRKYLLLLATQVASITYVAGLNPPPPPATYPNPAGDPVVVSTYSRRYTVFFYCNGAAFAASLAVIMAMVNKRIVMYNARFALTVLRSTLLLDLLALMVAFVAGSCRDVITSVNVSALLAMVLAYLAIHLTVAKLARKPADSCPFTHAEESAKESDRKKFLLLLATFATPLTYGAGLAPPGGFWTQAEGGHRAGDPLLHDGRFKIHYQAFFYANASSFVASLAIILVLMSRSLGGLFARSYALPVCVLVELLGLIAAFAAGSCRWITTTLYIISLVGAVLLYIVLQLVMAVFANLPDGEVKQAPPAHATITDAPQEEEEGRASAIDDSNNGEAAATQKVGQWRSLLLLLSTLAATLTYQAGLSPPGGVWPEGHLNHTPGNPVLLDMHPKRYKAFYHCNTAAFLASLVVIIILQSKELTSGAIIRRAWVNAVMMLGLFGLMGAYVAGSCRDNTTTMYVFSLAVAVFIYSIAKAVAYTAYGQKLARARVLLRLLHLPADDDHRPPLLRARKFLLQLAVLSATLTYQAGLNPPGGFWTESSEGEKLTAGDPVLEYYWTRYQVFFYCNATAFMASIAVILLLVNRTLHMQSIRGNVVHVCFLVGLLGFLVAYAAGSCRNLRASIHVISLMAVMVTVVILNILFYVGNHDRWLERPWLLHGGRTTGLAPAGQNKISVVRSSKFLRRKYVLMLLGTLGASVTYQAGLAPPGGTLGDDAVSWPSPSPSPLVVAGNPILLYSNLPRYQAFFYCNATSFVASAVLILLLFQRTFQRSCAPLWAMQTAVVPGQLGLLGAYATGSCRDWASTYALVAVFITLYMILSFHAVVNKVKKLKAWTHWGGRNSPDVY